MPPEPIAYFRGSFMPASEARVGVGTHALHYGTAIFEGIRANWNPEASTTYLFRMREHFERFLEGCHILRLDIGHSVDDLCRIAAELVERSGYQQDLYVRPLAFKGEERVAYLKLTGLESSLMMMAFPMGTYLDADAPTRCCTSSWRRVEDTAIPPRIKVSGLYVNSVLAKTEAAQAGFDEAILLTQDGYVSEGTGENVFVVKDGRLATPPASDGVLPGITRDTAMRLAREELGIETAERRIPRSELYLADEVFLSGTAAHMTPVGDVDHIPVRGGAPGPVTRRLSELYFDVIYGRNDRYAHWCYPVRSRVTA